MEEVIKNNTLTIAVVDDDPAVRDLLRRILSGYRLILADTFARLKSKLEQEIPHLLFLDVHLPDASGIDVCRFLRNDQRYRSMVIFLITGMSDDDLVQSGYTSGADDFIRKPFHPFEIKAKTAIVERIIQSTAALSGANEEIHEKKERFNKFGRLIQRGLGIRSREESLDTARPMREIIGADHCAAVRMTPEGALTLFTAGAAGTDPLPDPSRIIEKAGERMVCYAQIVKGGVRWHAAAVTVKQLRRHHDYVLFLKKNPFDADEREIVSIYGDFLNILSERADAEEEIQKKNREYKSEIHKIRTLQVSAMPQFREIVPFDIASTYLPAMELSGDFIDAFFIDEDTYQIILCDVSGHGIAASYVGNEFRTIFRAMSKPGRRPGEITKRVNEAAARDMKNLYYFSTVIICQINLRSGEIYYSVAGHPSPLLIRERESCWLEQTGPLVGLMDGANFMDETVTLGSGDILFLYTDGITEAGSPGFPDSGEMFGMKRIGTILAENQDYSSTDILHFIISALYEFTDYQDQKDDITAICVKRR